MNQLRSVAFLCALRIRISVECVNKAHEHYFSLCTFQMCNRSGFCVLDCGMVINLVERNHFIDYVNVVKIKEEHFSYRIINSIFYVLFNFRPVPLNDSTKFNERKQNKNHKKKEDKLKKNRKKTITI